MPGVTRSDAVRGRAIVHQKWGYKIPAHLLQLPDDSVFVFYAEPSAYNTAFSLMWNATFKTVVQAECTAGVAAGQMTQSQAVAQVRLASTGTRLAGFVTADEDHARRRVHVNPLGQEFDPVGAMAHEYIHFLSHREFYPRYYLQGGDNPFRIEGATDYLMLQCFADYYDALPGASRATASRHDAMNPTKPLQLDNRAAYSSNFQKTRAWILADSGNLDRLLNFLFDGTFTDLSQIRP
jgi:hypothetical protein